MQILGPYLIPGASGSLGKGPSCCVFRALQAALMAVAGGGPLLLRPTLCCFSLESHRAGCSGVWVEEGACWRASELFLDSLSMSVPVFLLPQRAASVSGSEISPGTCWALLAPSVARSLWNFEIVVSSAARLPTIYFPSPRDGAHASLCCRVYSF